MAAGHEKLKMNKFKIPIRLRKSLYFLNFNRWRANTILQGRPNYSLNILYGHGNQELF